MCGLVGLAAGDISFRHKQAFNELLIVDTIRGRDGTGVVAVDGFNTIDWTRQAASAAVLQDTKTYDRVVTLAKKVLIGHNRHATRGGITNQNTHPFEFSNVVGVHNGTIPYTTLREVDKNIKGYYETDSETLYAHIDHCIKEGATEVEAIRQTLGVLDDGAWALVMWLRSSQELAFLRNSERPLCYCFAEDKTVLAWASEPWMLRNILSRNNVKIDDDKVFLMPEDTLYLVKCPTSKDHKFNDSDISKFKVAGKPKKELEVFMGGNANSKPPALSQQRTSTEKQAVIIPFANQHKNGHYKPPYKDIFGNIIKKPDFDKKVKAAGLCTYCESHTAHWGEEVCFLPISHTGSPRYLCKTCCNDAQIMLIMRGLV